MKVYIATIQVAIVANNEIDASDALSESFRNIEPDGVIIDWGYSGVHGPVESTISPASYSEGDMFKG